MSSDPTDKRAGVDRQRADTTALCEVKEWTPVGFYVDNDRSASNGKVRPEWERLLADIKAGKVDAIAAWDQDRGWRMMHELEELRKFFTGLGREIKLATTGQGEIDLYSPTGVLTAQIKTAVSEHEIAMMRVRQCRAARAKAESGRPQWKAAFGYERDTRPKERDDGTRKVNPKAQKLVQRAYDAVRDGSSLGDIARMFNDAGAYGLNGKPWTASTVSLFLRKPRNAGLRDHNGELVYDSDGKPVKGTWPALVDYDTWKAVQHKVSEPGRAPGRKSVSRHLLTGVLLCGKPGCGGYLSGYQSKSGVGAYRCKKCLGVAVRAADVEPLVYGIVAGRLAKPDAVDLLKAELHDEAEAEKLRTEENTLRARLNEIADERADGLLTGPQAKRATDRILDKLGVLERRQQDQERLRVLDGIPLGRPEVAGAIRTLSADRFRAVMALLLTVTVVPVGKGRHVFDPARVQVNWR
ncbi:recombinase family protein [Mycobacterium sp. E2989]|uniref:recombinase family protein n=1 Tax=Mycobacterium sp. E2989 TaxID=1834140 RepID=UPI001E45F42B|nr:recombinase family protein [Mycobacterium sp. E2989]